MAETRGVRLRDVNTPNAPAAEDIIEIDRGQKEREEDRQVKELLPMNKDLVELERKLSQNQLKKHKQILRIVPRRGGKSKRKSHKTRKNKGFSLF